MIPIAVIQMGGVMAFLEAVKNTPAYKSLRFHLHDFSESYLELAARELKAKIGDVKNLLFYFYYNTNCGELYNDSYTCSKTVQDFVQTYSGL